MVKTSGIGWTLRVKVLETGKNAFTWIFRQSFDDERIIEMTLLNESETLRVNKDVFHFHDTVVCCLILCVRVAFDSFPSMSINDSIERLEN